MCFAQDLVSDPVGDCRHGECVGEGSLGLLLVGYFVGRRAQCQAQDQAKAQADAPKKQGAIHRDTSFMENAGVFCQGRARRATGYFTIDPATTLATFPRRGARLPLSTGCTRWASRMMATSFTGSMMICVPV